MTSDRPDGKKKTVEGIDLYWSRRLRRWVTIPDRDKPAFEPVTVPSYPVSIFVAGSLHDARVICGQFCDDVGLCVTVTATSYVYTSGDEPGVIVGLINYPRFPAEPADIFAKAVALAAKLIDGLDQQSCTIQAPDKTVWISFRDDRHD